MRIDTYSENFEYLKEIRHTKEIEIENSGTMSDVYYWQVGLVESCINMSMESVSHYYLQLDDL